MIIAVCIPVIHAARFLLTLHDLISISIPQKDLLVWQCGYRFQVEECLRLGIQVTPPIVKGMQFWSTSRVRHCCPPQGRVHPCSEGTHFLTLHNANHCFPNRMSQNVVATASRSLELSFTVEPPQGSWLVTLFWSTSLSSWMPYPRLTEASIPRIVQINIWHLRAETGMGDTCVSPDA